MEKSDKESYKRAYKRARRYIYTHARPIELARWQYHFEDGSREAVLEALACYQNSNGGFGHGLNPDYWNPHSSPVQTLVATEILWEIGMERVDAEHPIIQGILDYLSSGRDFDEEHWQYTVESNNKYPHAAWWHYPYSSWWKDTIASRFAVTYYPTAALAGFILYFEDSDTDFYDLAREIAAEAIAAFLQAEDISDKHVIFSFSRLYDYIIEAELEKEFPVGKLQRKLQEIVNRTITQDETMYITMWGINICKPSWFIISVDSLYYEENKEIAEFECEFIAKTQLGDGSWEVIWDWSEDYPQAWGVAKCWWKSRVIIDNLLYWNGIKNYY